MTRAQVVAKAAIDPDVAASLKRVGLLASSAGLLAISYYLAARLGLGFRFQNSQIGVVWPASAVLLSALLLTPQARWWLVLVATGLAHAAAIGSSIPAWRLLWQIAGNAVFAVATVEALRRLAGLPLHFGSRRQVVTYTGISLALPAIFGFATPAFVRSLFNLEPAYDSVAALLRTTLANATAMLLVAPVVLLWRSTASGG